jgi:hypothetical protein
MATEKNSEHDEHHSFPAWVTLGHTDDPINGFLKELRPLPEQSKRLTTQILSRIR